MTLAQAAEVAQVEGRKHRFFNLVLSSTDSLLRREVHPLLSLFLQLRHHDCLDISGIVVVRCLLNVFGLLRRGQLLSRCHECAVAEAVGSLRVGEREPTLPGEAASPPIRHGEVACRDVPFVDEVERLVINIQLTVVLVVLLQTDADLVDILKILRAVEGRALRVELTRSRQEVLRHGAALEHRFQVIWRNASVRDAVHDEVA